MVPSISVEPIAVSGSKFAGALKEKCYRGVRRYDEPDHQYPQPLPVVKVNIRQPFRPFCVRCNLPRSGTPPAMVQQKRLWEG